MCGIAGIFRLDGEAVQEESLQKMNDALRHRGPDGSGIYRDGPLGFAHNRLKIIDLSESASQPMKDETGRFHIIFNGEIYNYRELRKALPSKYKLFSHSDTEVILRLFQEKREKCWDDLRGMFTIAIYDAASRELFLARDHAGIKPLYYFRDGAKFVFASEIKALKASGLFPIEIDTTAIPYYLRLGYFPGALSPYRGIHKLLPGEWMRISAHGCEVQKYWNVRDSFHRQADDSSPETMLNLLLQESVCRHLVSDVPVGAFLSGGVDSSLLVALVSSMATTQVKTFTVGFSRMGYYDERPYARRVAELFQTEHHEFSVETGVEEIVPSLSTVFDEPFGDASAVPTLCLAEMTRKEVTVALSGTGGDEIFGGYRKYLASRWMGWYGGLPAAFRSAVQMGASLLPSSRKTLWQERALLLQRFAALDPQSRPEKQLNSIFKTEEIEEMTGESGLPSFQPVDGSAAENMMLFDYEYFLPDDLLTKEDRCAMRFGLEARVPYLDRDLVSFMISLPLEYKLSATSTKRLFKRVAARYLPPWILRRPKHGFGSPVEEWLRGDLHLIAEESLLGPRAYLKSKIVKRMFDEHQKKTADWSRQLWTILMFELWMRNQAGL